VESQHLSPLRAGTLHMNQTPVDYLTDSDGYVVAAYFCGSKSRLLKVSRILGLPENRLSQTPARGQIRITPRDKITPDVMRAAEEYYHS
jgi:hypothetical protein